MHKLVLGALRPAVVLLALIASTVTGFGHFRVSHDHEPDIGLEEFMANYFTDVGDGPRSGRQDFLPKKPEVEQDILQKQFLNTYAQMVDPGAFNGAQGANFIPIVQQKVDGVNKGFGQIAGQQFQGFVGGLGGFGQFNQAQAGCQYCNQQAKPILNARAGSHKKIVSEYNGLKTKQAKLDASSDLEGRIQARKDLIQKGLEAKGSYQSMAKVAQNWDQACSQYSCMGLPGGTVIGEHSTAHCNAQIPKVEEQVKHYTQELVELEHKRQGESSLLNVFLKKYEKASSDYKEYERIYGELADAVTYEGQYEQFAEMLFLQKSLQESLFELSVLGQNLGLSPQYVKGIEDLKDSLEISFDKLEDLAAATSEPIVDVAVNQYEYQGFKRDWDAVMSGRSTPKSELAAQLGSIVEPLSQNESLAFSNQLRDRVASDAIRYFFGVHIEDKDADVSMDVTYSHPYHFPRYKEVDASTEVLCELSGQINEEVPLNLVNVSVQDGEVSLALKGHGHELLVGSDLESIKNYVDQQRIVESVGLRLAPQNYEGAGSGLKNLSKQAASIIMDFLPYVGTAKGVDELIVGFDPVTGEKVSRVVSGFAVAGSVVPIPGAKVGGKYVGKAAVYSGEWIAKNWKGLATMARGRIGEEAARQTLRRAGYKEMPAKLKSNHGFDGVFVKKNGDEIADIIVSESKFSSTGKVRMGSTRKHGQQMEESWVEYTVKRMNKDNVDSSVQNTGKFLKENYSKIRRKVNVIGPDGANRWNTYKLKPAKDLAS